MQMMTRKAHRHPRRKACVAAPTILCLASLLVVRSALAQPVGAGSGPLSEVSRPLTHDSQPMHRRGQTVSEGSAGSMTSGPVRGNRRVGMLSGAVSDISVGPVTSDHPMSGGGSVTENSAGAVKQNMDHSLGEQVYDAQRALGRLQQRVRAQQDAAEAGAAERDDTATQDLDAPDVDRSQEEADIGTPEAPETAPEAAAAADPSSDAPESGPLLEKVEDVPDVDDETTN